MQTRLQTFGGLTQVTLGNKRSDDSSSPGAIAAPERGLRSIDVERYRWFTELAQDILVEVSALAHVLHVSPNVQTVLGFVPDELLGGSAFAHVHPEDLRHVQEQFARKSGQFTCRHRHKDGSWRWLTAMRRDLMAADSSIRHVVIVRDVNALKLAEEECDRLKTELVRLGKLAALGTLAGGVAHDFNNLLTAILAYSCQAQADTHQPEVAEALDHIVRASDRARQLTRQIVAFSRHERHEPHPVQLAPIVQEALGLLRPLIPAGIELRTELAVDAGVVMADPCQVHQIVLNLCTNALHAMAPHAGRLTVSVGRVNREEDRTLRAPDCSRANFVRLLVADTGRGMDSATRKRIFEPFFTTKPRGEGAGLGLAVVDRIVRDHRAVIQVSSQPGVGTTFHVLFPTQGDTERTPH